MGTDRSPHMNPEGEGTIRLIHGRVTPPIDGDEEVVMASIQPSDEAAAKRFIWYFHEQGHEVEEVTEIETDVDMASYLADHDPHVPDRIAYEFSQFLYQHNG